MKKNFWTDLNRQAGAKNAASFLLCLGDAMKEFEIRLTRKRPEDFVVSNQGVAPTQFEILRFYGPQGPSVIATICRVEQEIL
jgi:hypothetical protein